MRNVMRHADPPRTVFADLKPAAAVSLLLLLPLVALEFLSRTVDTRNTPGLVVLFGLLWLLPVAFIVTLAPLVRAVRAGGGGAAAPPNLLFRVALLCLVAAAWGAILFDQFPCFLGVPNCD